MDNGIINSMEFGTPNYVCQSVTLNTCFGDLIGTAGFGRSGVLNKIPPTAIKDTYPYLMNFEGYCQCSSSKITILYNKYDL